MIKLPLNHINLFLFLQLLHFNIYDKYYRKFTIKERKDGNTETE